MKLVYNKTISERAEGAVADAENTFSGNAEIDLDILNNLFDAYGSGHRVLVDGEDINFFENLLGEEP